MMDLPEIILEQIFLYLNWDDRSRAARVCRKWLFVFHSPSLWRTLVFRPPKKRMTRMQYDMKGYRMSCCLRAIGWHVKNYRFIKSEDIFLLNRTLSLVAKFLEANPSISDVKSHADMSSMFTVPDEYMDLLDQDESNTESFHEQSDIFAENAFDQPESTNHGYLSDYADAISGDPDAKATLKLILKLEERAILGIDSSASSSSEEDDLPNILAAFRSSSLSSTPVVKCGIGRSCQRSHSCRYTNSSLTPRQRLDVKQFSLAFHCELDEPRAFVYGTGGALLSTIRRLVRQLTVVECVCMTDLFLTVADARNLILDLHQTASNSLTDLNLVNLNKPATERTFEPFPRLSAVQLDGSNRHIVDEWYLLDPRWLRAHPHRVHQNPMADLASLFPRLSRLTLAPTQLTTAMLLRLLYQTNLHELILFQNDFTTFTMLDFMEGNLAAANHEALIQADEHEFGSGLFEDDLIDWSDDVPHYRNRSNPLNAFVTLSDPWKPISAASWHAAQHICPRLCVCLKHNFLRPTSEDTYSSQNNPVSLADRLVTLWPVCPSPVGLFSLMTSQSLNFVKRFLNGLHMGTYSATLTTLILFIDPSESLSPSSSYAKNDVVSESQELNELFRNLPLLYPNLRELGFGGDNNYLSVITLLQICRHYGRRFSTTHTHFSSHSVPTPLNLVVQNNCCRFDDPSPPNLSATISVWYSTVISHKTNRSQSEMASKQCIRDALHQPSWEFVTRAQFLNRFQHFSD